MDNTIKVWLLIAAVLVILGALIFTAIMALNHWDFSKLSTTNYVTNPHSISEAFTDLALEVDAASIRFVPSDDGICQVVCVEDENALHSVTTENGCLTIGVKDQRKWYHHIGIYNGTAQITVTLPRGAYQSLLVKGSTGNVELADNFSFKRLGITISTGNIHIEDLSAGDLSLKVSTGHITATGIDCTGIMTVTTSTGKTTLRDVSCSTFGSTGSTGKITLENVLVAKELSIKRSTGNVNLMKCDAQQLSITTNTGDVTGTLLSDKMFSTQTSTGKVSVPPSTTGGKCQITTNTGDIKITIEE